MNNQTSNLAQMLRLELHDNGKKYLLWALIFIGSLAAVVCFATIQYYDYYSPYNLRYGFEDPMMDFEETIFWTGLIILGCVSASLTFLPLGSKGGAISNLMLPATQLEKYASRWLIFVPGFIIGYFLCFELVDLLRYVVLYYKLDSHDLLHPIGLKMFDMEVEALWALIGISLALQSFFVLGSSIWPKRGYLCTALWLFAIVAACSICSAFYYTFLISHTDKKTIFESSLNSDALAWTFVGLAFLACIVNYVLAYFRYKEIEIVPRW